MLFDEIIQNLYSGDESSILEILNTSVHVQELDFLDNEPAIHTGFYCYVHTGSLFEFIYIIPIKQLCYKKVSSNTNFAPLGLPYISEYCDTIVSVCFKHQKGIWYSLYDSITDTFSFIETDEIKEYEIQDKKAIKVNAKDNNFISQFKIKTKIHSMHMVNYEGTNARTLSFEEKEFNYELNPHFFPTFYKSKKFYKSREDYREDRIFCDENRKVYEKYSGTYAQDIEGLDDDFIDDVLGGEPEAYWNID